MEDKIKNVMAAVFDISVDKITDKSSPDNVKSWDSLKHMNLILALEEEFSIEFSDDEIIELMNFKLINLIINEKVK